MKVFFGLRILVISLFLLLSFAAVAQTQQGKSYLFKGKLIDADSGVAVSFAHIANPLKGTITAGKNDGAFTIPVDGGDTLVITRVGYTPLKYAVPMQAPQGVVSIALAPMTEEMQEVVISRFPSEGRLKEQILSLKLPEEKGPNLHVPHPSTVVESNTDGGVTLLKKGGMITGFANKFNDKERGRQFKARMEIEEAQKAYIATRFNKDIVQRITGLEDDEKLNEFMKFCVLPDKFLLESTEYQIHEAVLGCFKEFLAER